MSLKVSVIIPVYNTESYLRECLESVLNQTYDNIEISNLIKPSLNVLKIIDKHKNDKGINPHILNPNYLKLTEAEEKLNDKRD